MVTWSFYDKHRWRNCLWYIRIKEYEDTRVLDSKKKDDSQADAKNTK
jgi:hypothetical protein